MANDLGFGDDYSLVFYSVPFPSLPKEVHKDPMTFLEQHGRQCGREISFPPGKVFHFFECVKEVCQLDMLQLVGGGHVGGPYPNEDELCCGSAEREVLLMLVAKIMAISKGNDEERAKVIQAARDNFLDAKWFITTLYLVKEAVEQSLQLGGSTMALFE